MFPKAWFSRTLPGLLAVSVLMAIPVTSGQAQPAPALQVATCQQDFDAFLKTNPSKEQLATTVRDFLLNNRQQTSTIMPCIIATGQKLNAELDAATGDRKSQIEDVMGAIGAGLGQAALAMAASNPDLANQIQVAIADSGILSFIRAYTASTGNTLTAAIGGGGTGNGGPTGAAGAPISGGGGGDGGSAQSNGVGNGTSFLGGGGVTGGGGGGTTTTTQTVNSPVTGI
ncbi:hypothetical protein [Rhodoplanes sp. Z2-YC6860]|uniref:hypothetical protein n=1 Tax=Rhodoplanes sp. Z2-YC6860 TaxID=674703 RepID=UPI0012ECCE7C|nr:hypothetical protein [Rhodoplanes sp. Z2-YC6860]